jgi:hypothetical protein
MHRVCSLIAGVVTALTLAGCSETAPETGTVQFKGSQSPGIDALRDSMAKNAAGGKSPAKSSNGTAKSATDAKAGEPKAATATKEDEKP